jgi:hypothetical protein
MSKNDNYTNEQYQALKYSNEQFDKNVLFIASGALGISFAFIEKIVNLKVAQCKALLICSWYLFAGVIFISLFAHFISIMINRWAITNNPDNNKYYNRNTCIFNWSVRLLNISMIVGLLIGIILLIHFINLNI